MAYLIDPTYFIQGLEIPNKTGLHAVNTAIDNSIDWYISVYEPEVLTMLLGATLYAELLAGLAVLPTPDAKWTALKNKIVDSTKKISLIANYTYFKYANDKINLGIPDESPVFFNHDRTVKAWNNMTLLNEKLFDFLIANISDYPNWTIESILLNGYGYEINLVSLFKTVNVLGI